MFGLAADLVQHLNQHCALDTASLELRTQIIGRVVAVEPVADLSRPSIGMLVRPPEMMMRVDHTFPQLLSGFLPVMSFLRKILEPYRRRGPHAVAYCTLPWIPRSPERLGPPHDRRDRQHAEIPAIHRVRMQVHEEYFIVCKVVTALPVGQRSAAGVAFERLPHLDAINRYLISNTANRLIRNGTNAFEQRHATREMTSIGQKCRERLRWNDDRKIVHHQLTRR